MKSADLPPDRLLKADAPPAFERESSMAGSGRVATDGGELPDEDGALLAAVRCRDRDAMAMLYTRHAWSMLLLGRRILKDRGAAEDLVHDILLELWTNEANYDPQRGALRSWLHMRVRCRAIDRARSLSRAGRYAALVRASGSVAFARQENALADRADQLRARDAVAALPREQRSVVELNYYGDLTLREIADCCEIPIGTAKSRLGAAIAKLRLVMRLSPDSVRPTSSP